MKRRYDISVEGQYEVAENGCWVWQGWTDAAGYGLAQRGGRPWKAHRLSWTAANGPIPSGMTVDHICFNPSCANPGHLQLLTPGENSARKQSVLSPTCKNGHEWTADNTATHTLRSGPEAGRAVRRCRQCARDFQRAWQRRRRAELRGVVA